MMAVLTATMTAAAGVAATVPAIMLMDTIPAPIPATPAQITVMAEDMLIPAVIPAELMLAEAMVAAGAAEDVVVGAAGVRPVLELVWIS